jgi:hypothetical protein
MNHTSKNQKQKKRKFSSQKIERERKKKKVREERQRKENESLVGMVQFENRLKEGALLANRSDSAERSVCLAPSVNSREVVGGSPLRGLHGHERLLTFPLGE